MPSGVIQISAIHMPYAFVRMKLDRHHLERGQLGRWIRLRRGGIVRLRYDAVRCHRNAAYRKQVMLAKFPSASVPGGCAHLRYHSVLKSVAQAGEARARMRALRRGEFNLKTLPGFDLARTRIIFCCGLSFPCCEYSVRLDGFSTWSITITSSIALVAVNFQPEACFLNRRI